MFTDSRVVQAEAGDVEAARELIVDLAYSVSHKEPLSDAVIQYFVPRLLKIAEGADANKCLHLVSAQGRPSMTPDRAYSIVNLVLDKIVKGVPKSRAFSELEDEGKCIYITKQGKEESLTAKQISRIFKTWALQFYTQARLDAFLEEGAKARAQLKKDKPKK